MNIHEHQAKKILKKYGAIVPEGVFSYSVEELLQKAKSLKTEKFVLKAQIHAGGRGKAGGIKIVTTKINLDDKISYKDCEKIVEIFNLSPDAKKQAITLIKSIYKMFIDIDANLVEINPLILTKELSLIHI